MGTLFALGPHAFMPLLFASSAKEYFADLCLLDEDAGERTFEYFYCLFVILLAQYAEILIFVFDIVLFI